MVSSLGSLPGGRGFESLPRNERSYQGRIEKDGQPLGGRGKRLSDPRSKSTPQTLPWGYGAHNPLSPQQPKEGRNGAQIPRTVACRPCFGNKKVVIREIMPTAFCNTCQELTHWANQRGISLKNIRCQCGSKDLAVVSGHLDGDDWVYTDRKGEIRKIEPISSRQISSDGAADLR